MNNTISYSVSLESVFYGSRFHDYIKWWTVCFFFYLKNKSPFYFVFTFWWHKCIILDNFFCQQVKQNTAFYCLSTNSEIWFSFNGNLSRSCVSKHCLKYVGHMILSINKTGKHWLFDIDIVIMEPNVADFRQSFWILSLCW